jgi:hypothetical protein
LLSPSAVKMSPKVVVGKLKRLASLQCSLGCSAILKVERGIRI